MSRTRVMPMRAASHAPFRAASAPGSEGSPRGNAALVPPIAGSSTSGGNSDRSGTTRHTVHRHRSDERYRSGWFAHHAERWEETSRPMGRAQIQRSKLEAARRLASGEQIP